MEPIYADRRQSAEGARRCDRLGGRWSDKARQTQSEQARPKDDRPSPRDQDGAQERRSRFTPAGGQVQSRRGVASLDAEESSRLATTGGQSGTEDCNGEPSNRNNDEEEGRSPPLSDSARKLERGKARNLGNPARGGATSYGGVQRQASAGARDGAKGKRNDLAARAPLHAIVRRPLLEKASPRPRMDGSD